MVMITYGAWDQVTVSPHKVVGSGQVMTPVYPLTDFVVPADAAPTQLIVVTPEPWLLGPTKTRS
jgi:hypothetical protein